MTSDQPQQFTASSARSLYWALLGGLLAIMAVFGSLVWLGSAPVMGWDEAGVQMVAGVLGTVGLGSLALGWFWARPKMPLSPAGNDPSAFWDDPTAGPRAILLWVLWEGGSLMATVGALLTQSVLTEVVAAIGLTLLLTHSPSYLENRSL